MEPRPPISHLVWDDWNLAHVTKHAVERYEAEEVVGGEPMFSNSYKDRVVITGPTKAGRMVTVVAGPTPGDPTAFYIFSARPASRQERATYAGQRGGPTL